VLVPVKVNVPAPAFVKEAAEVPLLIIPVISLVPVLVTLKFPETFKAAAVNTSVEIVIDVGELVAPTAPVNVVSPVPLVVILND
jgi:hypothetical protein